MIPIRLASEPADFDRKVRRPGRTYLRANPNPTSKQFNKHAYWKECLQSMCTKYRHICAYSACWIPTGATVDHYHPKSARPALAYEWDNYRLALDRVNHHKGNSTDVADPVHIQPGWFVLDFHNFFVKQGPNLPPDVGALVQTTIDRLRLNDDQTFVNMRFELVRSYSRGQVTLEFLREKYPFIAVELERQGLTSAIKGTFRI